MKIIRAVAPVVTVLPEAAAQTTAFYEKLLGQTAHPRLSNPAGTLSLTVIGGMLIIAGEAKALATRTALKATMVVECLEDAHRELLEHGCVVLEAIAAGPMADGKPLGRFMFVRHPDGALFEYFEPSA
jgi:hypothetical protein